jgi:hypothetical protein
VILRMADQLHDRNVGRLSSVFYHGVVRPNHEVDCAPVVLLIVALTSSAAGSSNVAALPSDGAYAYRAHIFFRAKRENRGSCLVLTSKIKLYSPYSYL